MAEHDAIPKYHELMLSVLKAVDALGGSASAGEIISKVLDDGRFSDELIAVNYQNRDKSVLVDRIEWARSYCKLSGVLDSPRRGLYLLSELGKSILTGTDGEAMTILADLNRSVRKQRSKNRGKDLAELDDETADEVDGWREELLGRLHQLSPDGFERFALYLLRSLGMELERVGGPGDEGIDGIGTAPLSPLLTTTVAVQAKRYEPSKTVGRETVALFQADAIAAGAEHGILMTTGRFSAPAKRAAMGRNPTIDLVDGDRLAGLCQSQQVGVEERPTVLTSWFDRFDE